MTKIKLKNLPLTMVHVKGNGAIQDFWIADTPVTQALWRAVMGSNPSELYNKGCDECPVENVSWNDIVNDFLPKLNQLTGKTYRLPTEAEWEYAACGGNKSQGYMYAGSNELDKVAWYYNNYEESHHGSEGTTHPVKTKAPNELGLYDLSGNVWEWCEDDWHGNYEDAPQDGRAWIDSPRDLFRVNRGGGWVDFAQHCRSANRNLDTSTIRRNYIGFRLAI